MPKKFIRIFFAYSEELVVDRKDFGDFINQLNNIYIKRGIYFELFKWEYSDASFKIQRKQDEYNEKIVDSDIFLSLFHTKAGKHTIEEFDFALERYMQEQKPRIYVFFKKLKDGETEDESLHAFKKRLNEELTHYSNSYDSSEKLKLDFILQIKYLDLDTIDELKCEDSAVFLNGEKIINLKSIPYYNKNKDYVQLKADFDQLENRFLVVQERIIKYPEDESCKSELLDISMEKNSKKKELEKLEKDIFSLAEQVAEASTKNYSSIRLKKAREYLDNGEMAAAFEVLDTKEIGKEAQSTSESLKRELPLKSKLYESIMAKERLLAGNVQEYLVKARISSTYYSNENRFADARQYYKKASSLEKDNNLDRIATLQYAEFLHKQNEIKEAESSYAECIEYYMELAQKNPQAYLPVVARIQSDLANLLAKTLRMEEAEVLYKESLGIRKEQAQKDPEAHLSDVADTQNNLAILYAATQRMEEAEAMYKASLGIMKELVQKNREAHLSDVATVQNNLAILYAATQRIAEAEALYTASLGIRKELAQKNPEAYLPAVADTQGNLAILYDTTRRIAEAEVLYMASLGIRKELAQKNPETHLSDVARSQNNLANLYQATQRMEEAEALYKESLDIRKEQVQRNPETYLPAIAVTKYNLAILYAKTQRMVEAEEQFKESLGISKELADKNREAHLLPLAKIQNSLAKLYEATHQQKEAEKTY